MDLWSNHKSVQIFASLHFKQWLNLFETGVVDTYSSYLCSQQRNSMTDLRNSGISQTIKQCPFLHLTDFLAFCHSYKGFKKTYIDSSSLVTAGNMWLLLWAGEGKAESICIWLRNECIDLHVFWLSSDKQWAGSCFLFSGGLIKQETMLNCC